MFWLIIKDVFDQIQAQRESGRKPTAQETAEFLAEFETIADELPRIMSVAGETAGIGIVGVLTNAPDYWARWYGGGNTTYAEIRSAIALADSDPAINEIVLQVNSPGGIAGAEQQATVEAIQNCSKPVRAIVGGMAASAAYGLVAQAETIEAQNAMSMVGSIGVVHRAVIRDDVVQTTSTNAPAKRPDPTTKAGKKVIKEQLDSMEKIFIDTIAEGRDVDAATVKKDFGRGAIILAEDAIKRNMIDSISAGANSFATPSNDGGDSAVAATAKVKPQAAAGGVKKESKTMDLTKLKAEHPAVFQAAFAEGAEQGKKDERDRVSAHLTYGAGADCMDVAMKAIEDGEQVTQALQAKYMMAGLNKKDVADNAADSADASAVVAGATTPAETDQDAEDDKMANVVAAHLGTDDADEELD